jgi:hypothetical protein
MATPCGEIRVRSGAEIAAETVSNVTVVVAWFDGLDMLAARRSATEVRAILNALLDALNAAAATYGAVMPRKSDWRRAYETDILRRNHATKVANSSEHRVDEA